MFWLDKNTIVWIHRRQRFGVVAGCYAIAFGGVLVGTPAWAMASRVTKKAPPVSGEYFISLKLSDDTDEQRFVEVSSCPFGHRPYQTGNFSTIE